MVCHFSNKHTKPGDKVTNKSLGSNVMRTADEKCCRIYINHVAINMIYGFFCYFVRKLQARNIKKNR